MSQEYFRVRAYIDEAALRHNIRVIKEKIGPEVAWIGVVKSNAYGHGVENVVPILEEEGARFLAVACLDEALKLRSLGWQYPILILGYTDESEYREALKADVRLTIYRTDQALALNQAAETMGKQAPIHVKIETGMARIGFACTKEAAKKIAEIARLPYIQAEGLFTHFARADEVNKEQAEMQLSRFTSMVNYLEEEGCRIPLHHTANSAAIMEYPASHREYSYMGSKAMARAGIMLYGLYPSGEMSREDTELKPVLSLISHVIHVKEVPAGTPIGYGGTYVTEAPSRIATIPVGYGDGYPRRASNRGHVLIGGKVAPIRGRVCMDQMMVDVTEIPDVKPGDKVELIGPGLGADQLAEWADTISYEIVCQLTGRVPRVLQPSKQK